LRTIVRPIYRTTFTTAITRLQQTKYTRRKRWSRCGCMLKRVN